MKEYPILFSGEMIRAIRREVNPKSVTRRIDKRWLRVKAGDILWPRETWRPSIAHSHGMNTCDCGDVNVLYVADGENRFFRDEQTSPEWTIPKAAATGNVSPLFMPRWASRITLEATEDARLEKLCDITEGEAQSEGVERLELSPRTMDFGAGPAHVHPMTSSYVDAFAALWSTLHTKPGERWIDDPDVVRLAFRRVP